MEESFKDQYNVGDHIVLKLIEGDIFEGDVANVAKGRIDIVNVVQHNNKNKLTGIYSFYQNEIDKVKKLKSKAKGRATSEDTSALEENDSFLSLSEEEYNRLKDITREYVYIEKADSQYFKVVELLSKAETIGVVGLGVEKSRAATIKLLAVSTWDKVYLFDFMSLKQSSFYPELKDILEADYPCKVIHEAGPLLDILYRNYKVFVRNTFDTQLVDLIIKRKETGIVPNSLQNLGEMLTDYFNFPSTFFEKALNVNNKRWAKRPLSERKLEYAAQLVAYLITVKEKMQRILFGEIYEAIDKIHDFYFHLDCFQFSKNWQDHMIPKDIQNLIPNLRRMNISPNETAVTSRSISVEAIMEPVIPVSEGPSDFDSQSDKKETFDDTNETTM